MKLALLTRAGALLLPDTTPLHASLRLTFNGLSNALQSGLEVLHQAHEEASSSIRRWHEVRITTTKLFVQSELNAADMQLKSQIIEPMRH